MQVFPSSGPRVLLSRRVACVDLSSQYVLLLLILQGPARHYVSNALWIIINVFCLLVTFHQLRRLDTEYRGSQSASKHDEDSSEVRI